MRTRYAKPGSSPGLTVISAEGPIPEFPVQVISYDKDQLTDAEVSLADLPPPDPGDGRVTWVRFPTMPDPTSLAHFGERWAPFAAAKRKHDPGGILNPGFVPLLEGDGKA